MSGVVMLCGLAAWLGYIAGTAPTESEMIDHYAAIYVRDHGGKPTDCYAMVYDIGNWFMSVHCKGQDDVTVDYRLGYKGELIRDPMIERPNT